MAARHGKLGEFQPGIDQVEDYQERFVLYCAANKLAGDDAAETRKAVPLTSVHGFTHIGSTEEPGQASQIAGKVNRRTLSAPERPL